ncbi:hypothetical protein K431DRAFT_307727 [Polychaeton citri CBS 116435]|uniref:Uncharacterized protein n=1 Tax=Polychaeton citri CBS 116435 TaxID=1314669 RepID=A0A9P4UJL0_9PEZI|nr:hypothetical protein K431DRAFT_307727 [Polychaeton citri CBS 116435]
MQLIQICLLAAPVAYAAAIGESAGVSPRAAAITYPKANEYKDDACSVGSYTHHSGVLGCVNFDSTTNSVYFTNGDSMYGKFVGYGCADCNCPAYVGSLPEKCVNINTVRPGRVQSVQQVEQT